MNTMTKLFRFVKFLADCDHSIRWPWSVAYPIYIRFANKIKGFIDPNHTLRTKSRKASRRKWKSQLGEDRTSSSRRL